MITSLSNDKVKLTRALARKRARWQERCFILEGMRQFKEAARRDFQPRFVLYTEDAMHNEEMAQLVGLLSQKGVRNHQVSHEVMVACSDTVTPPGLLAVVPFPELPVPVKPTWTLVVDNVRTPGNLGAILRTAAAAGVNQVLLSPGTVDLYNPKVVRGAAGTHLFLPILPLSWTGIRTQLQGLTVWLAAARGDLPYDEVDWNRPLALIVGGEAHGSSQDALALADGYVAIPMAQGVESLNVAVAAGVLLFEIARQRRGAERILE